MMVPDSAVEAQAGSGKQGTCVTAELVFENSGAAKPVPRLTPSTPWRKLVSFPVFLAALLVAAVFLAVSLRLQDVASAPAGHNRPSFVEGDSWWHLATGERILATHTWPTTNYSSFTAPNSDWIAYEWLGEVAMALAMRHGRLQGMAALLLGLAAVIVLLLYYYAYLRSGDAKAACVACAMVLPLVGTCFTLRPQLLGYVFLLITLISLERFRQGRQKWLWILPALFVLWVNTHGTFVFGFLAIFVYWASGLASVSTGAVWTERWTRRQRLHLELVFLLSVLALAVTPYGTRLIGYVLNAALDQPANLANIQEWQPLGFDQVFGKVFLALLLLWLLAQVAWRPKYRLQELALVIFALWSACIHQRFLPLFAVMFAPILAMLLTRWVPPYDRAKDRYALNAALVVGLLAGVAAFFPSNKQLDQLVAENYPVAAIAYIRQHPVSERMLNEHSWGGYLMRAMGPARRVFIDGREDAYEPAGVFSDYLDITRLHGNALLLLRKYGIEACLIEREAPLGTLLASLPAWRKVYGDEVSTLFVRNASINSEQADEPHRGYASKLLPQAARQ